MRRRPGRPNLTPAVLGGPAARHEWVWIRGSDLGGDRLRAGIRSSRLSSPRLESWQTTTCDACGRVSYDARRPRTSCWEDVGDVNWTPTLLRVPTARRCGSITRPCARSCCSTARRGSPPRTPARFWTLCERASVPLRPPVARSASAPRCASSLPACRLTHQPRRAPLSSSTMTRLGSATRAWARQCAAKGPFDKPRAPLRYVHQLHEHLPPPHRGRPTPGHSPVSWSAETSSTLP